MSFKKKFNTIANFAWNSGTSLLKTIANFLLHVVSILFKSFFTVFVIDTCNFRIDLIFISKPMSLDGNRINGISTARTKSGLKKSVEYGYNLSVPKNYVSISLHLLSTLYHGTAGITNRLKKTDEPSFASSPRLTPRLRMRPFILSKEIERGSVIKDTDFISSGSHPWPSRLTQAVIFDSPRKLRNILLSTRQFVEA